MEIHYSNIISKAKSYPFAEIDKKVKQLQEKKITPIDFGIGDPKEPTPQFVIDALSKAAQARAADGYPSYIGELSYRESCAFYMQNNFGIGLDPHTEISSTVGSKESIFNFPLGFINPGDIVICPTPGYPVYKIGTEFAGGQPYFVPLLKENDFLIDFKSIPEDIAKKAKVIWINYPNSPTGVMAPIEWLRDFVAWANKYDIIIASDEGCYIDLYFKEKPHSILEIQKEGIITFYSLSKRSNMTGYRVGFVAGDAKIIDGFKKVKTNIDSGTPTFIQDAASLALRDTEHVEFMRQEYARKRDILIPALESLGFPRTTANSTFYIWQEITNGISDIEFSNKLLDYGIVVTPGSFISDVADGKNPGENFVRFALVPTIEEVTKAAEIISKIRF
jgi:LL-diaminopimelate aminotransferase